MAFQRFEREGGDRNFQRQMFDVTEMNVKCRDCGTPITQLPFNPDPSRLDTLRCQDCLRKFRETRPRRF